MSKASCSTVDTSFAEHFSEPEMEAASEPENAGTPVIAKEEKQHSEICRRSLRFLQEHLLYLADSMHRSQAALLKIASRMLPAGKQLWTLIAAGGSRAGGPKGSDFSH